MKGGASSLPRKTLFGQRVGPRQGEMVPLLAPLPVMEGELSGPLKGETAPLQFPLVVREGAK